MGKFSSDLFLRLAKDAAEQGDFRDKDGDLFLSNVNIQDGEIANGLFDDTGKKDIEKFKDAVFMILMLRAHKYMLVNCPEASTTFPEHAYTNFGITLIEQDVHASQKPNKDLNSVTGGIGLKIDSYYLDDPFITNLADTLFTKGASGAPMVNLACTLTQAP